MKSRLCLFLYTTIKALDFVADSFFCYDRWTRGSGRMIYLAAFTCLFWFIVWADASIGMNKITKLEKVSIDRSIFENGPLLSIIVAARNEEEHIKASLQSQFSQSYPNIEWIVVNDRSTDDTKIILDQMATTEPRMNVIHVPYTRRRRFIWISFLSVEMANKQNQLQ